MEQKLNELFINQGRIGEEIQTLIRNYKKNSNERKAKIEYFQEKISKLTSLWNSFADGDAEIKGILNGKVSDNTYMTSNYYSKIMEIKMQYEMKFKNQMVIIKEDNMPCLQWPIGRIIKVYPGLDNHIRVVDVKTATGIFKRPIHRLALLFPEGEEDMKQPLEDEEASQPKKKKRT